MAAETKALSAYGGTAKPLYCVDLVKYICALLVVAIHVPPLSSFSPVISDLLRNCLARAAVPFFFVCSGFFLFRKLSPSDSHSSVPLRYSGRILRLYAVWTVIYFPLELRQNILTDDQGFLHGLLGWVRRCIFTGSYEHLWYLNALFFAVLLLTFCLRRGVKGRAMAAFGICLYILGLSAQTYTVFLAPMRNSETAWRLLKLVQKVILTTRNGLFEGFLFAGMGLFFARRPFTMDMRKARIGFLASLVLLILEYLAVTGLGWAREYDLYISLIPAVFFLFYLAAHTELKASPVYGTLRSMSSLTYYLHLLISPMVLRLLVFFDCFHSLAYYGLTVLLCAGVSIGLAALSRRPGLGWLKRLYQ